MVCSVEGCEKASWARGWCPMHYRRWRIHGSVLHGAKRGPVPRPLDQRIEGKFLRGDGCWPWTASLDGTGYGQIRHEGAALPAHRVVYEVLVGPIPEGYEVDHTCHNADVSCKGGPTCLHRRCVNPAHLEAVTASVNVTRCWAHRKAG